MRCYLVQENHFYFCDIRHVHLSFLFIGNNHSNSYTLDDKTYMMVCHFEKNPIILSLILMIVIPFI